MDARAGELQVLGSQGRLVISGGGSARSLVLVFGLLGCMHETEVESNEDEEEGKGKGKGKGESGVKERCEGSEQ